MNKDDEYCRKALRVAIHLQSAGEGCYLKARNSLGTNFGTFKDIFTMGASGSKEFSAQDVGNGPFSRTFSMPLHGKKNEVKDSSKLSWKSRLFSMSAFETKGKDYSSTPRFSSKLRPVKEEDCELDHEEQLDQHSSTPEVLLGRLTLKDESPLQKGALRHMKRSLSFQPLHETVEKEGVMSPSCSSSYRDLQRSELSNVTNLGSRRQLSRSVSLLPTTPDRSTGLGLLLDPVLIPQSIASPTRGTNLKNSLSLTGKSHFGQRYDTGAGLSTRSKTAQSGWLSTASPFSLGEGELFEPSVIASFEKAIEASSEDNWQSSEFSNSENISTSSSDADSPKDLSTAKEQSIANERRTTGSGAYYRKSSSFVNLFSCFDANKEWSRQDYLDKFEMRCPPGCEGKVVLYFTSLRGVRKTFDDCCTLRSILKGFRVHVDERDVWMHAKYRQELMDVMGAALPVPRLYVLGCHIGGAEEVQQLHEEGILARLLDGLPTEVKQVCDVCGDARFVPCTTCSGSCKTIDENDTVQRCLKCNENGLIMCPSCSC